MIRITTDSKDFFRFPEGIHESKSIWSNSRFMIIITDDLSIYFDITADKGRKPRGRREKQNTKTTQHNNNVHKVTKFNQKLNQIPKWEKREERVTDSTLLLIMSCLAMERLKQLITRYSLQKSHLGRHSDSVKVTFINLCGENISIHWVDYDGEEVEYFSVDEVLPDERWVVLQTLHT